MAKLSLRPSFVKDSLMVFRQRGLKGLLFGTKAQVSPSEALLINNLKANYQDFAQNGGRQGTFVKIDVIHKGSGHVYLIASLDNAQQSLVVFGNDTVLTNGPDLWLYVSDSAEPKNSFGNFLNLGLLHGNKGGQVYTIEQPLNELHDRASIIIYCKQFDVLFSYALLQ